MERNIKKHSDGLSDGLRAVIYARYSSDNQREESIEGQLRENTAFAEKNGLRIVGHYIDRAFSAKSDERPEFQRMIKDSAKRGFDLIIVWKLDRFSRNRHDSAIYKAMLKKNGVRVVSATEAISEGAEGILLESLLEGLAEYYSADLAEKITRGMTENALKCKYNGSVVPYGYVIDAEKNYQIDPIVAPIVIDIFNRYAAGETITSIINDFNGRGVYYSKGKPFTKSSMNRMLQNRIYIGEYHFNDVIVPNGVPAMVSLDVFERASKRMESNKRASAKGKAPERYILTTKLFCGKCKTMMVGDSAQKKNGTIYRYYKCAAAKKHQCDKKAVRKEWIEELVLERVLRILNDTETLNKIADSIMELMQEENTLIPALEAQLKEVRKSIDNVMKAIEMGVITRSTKARLEELESEEERISTSILAEQAKQGVLTKEQILFTMERFRNLDITVTQNRERLIDSFVKSILLYDDKLIITFTFKDDPIAVPTGDELDLIENSSDIKMTASPKREEPPNRVALLFLSSRIRIERGAWQSHAQECAHPTRRSGGLAHRAQGVGVFAQRAKYSYGARKAILAQMFTPHIDNSFAFCYNKITNALSLHHSKEEIL